MNAATFFRYLLYVLHLFLGLNGLVGGALLMVKQDGSLLQMDPSWLNQSPFQSYVVPGFLLFTFLGVLPLITLFGLIKNTNSNSMNVLNLYAEKNWAWAFSLYVGVSAICWITVQLILTRYFWIQPVIIFNGLAIIVCTLLPDVMKHYERKNH